MTLNLEKHLSTRAKELQGSLGKQTSVPIQGLINLGSGTPDFIPPQAVFDAMQEAISSSRVQYTTWTGIPDLRKAIAAKLKSENNLDYNPDTELIVTSGAQEALMMTLMTLLDPGDHALIPSPHYDEYTRDTKILGGQLIPVATTPESNFTIEVADLEAAITPRTKAIVIVSPNNPTGTVLSRERLQAIGELAIKHDLIIVSDEIYEYYIFDDNKHTSIASLPGLRERTITMNSFSKSFAMTGLRLGYVAAPEALIDAMLPFHHAMMICANVVTQYGGLAALTEPRDWFKDVLKEYDRRRQAWMALLDSIGIGYSKPQGAYYIFIDIRSTGLTSAAFVKRAREEAKLVFQPGTIGGGAGEGFIRGALTTPSPTFEEGLERFKAFIARLKS
ncbi:MAG: aminotransferase class I/II-fold pyridoxal phosphate-dependent enzyme [Chloroflexi bacterium]|nr:aminotransferase class I/II-fold pyridoxal phosphate-dependent enzyme [Chloroflexota bacterium]MCC6895293.1 aminotransferase class I/II-fold pyridoxal phosphate-dependent enzyme [Anaerolineae bacterium]